MNLTGWAATVACLFAAIRAAKAFAEDSPRLYTVFALFALSWALLLPYYAPVPAKTELLPAFNGFLLVYIGKLLRREAEERSRQSREFLIDAFAIWLLGFIAVPSLAPFFNVQNESVPIVELWIGTVLTLLGYVSIAHGLKRLYEPSGAWRWMAVYLVLDGIVEVGYAVQYPGSDWEGIFDVLFLFSKLIFTGLFIGLVVWKTVPEEDRRPGWLILKLLGIVGRIPRRDAASNVRGS